MGIVHNSIGLRFENYLSEEFPELIRITSSPDVPDFYHPHGFYIEAKAGNVQWGGRLHGYQMKQINKSKEPVVYCFGMHNFDNATKRLCQNSEGWRQRCLKKNMNIVELYFISGSIVNKILRNDEKISAAGKKYTMVKPCTLRNIILDREFERGNNKIPSSADYYGFDRKNYSANANGFLQYFLDFEKEKVVIDFLNKR